MKSCVQVGVLAVPGGYALQRGLLNHDVATVVAHALCQPQGQEAGVRRPAGVCRGMSG